MRFPRVPHAAVRPRSALPALAFALAAAPLAAQSFKQEIPLTGLGSGAARPFGIAVEPVSDRLFVGVAGTFAASNDVVAILDPVTDTVLGTIQVGRFPEDVAFAYDALGQPRYGAVTNSSDGSVTIWDAGSDLVVATVPLPDPLGFGTCYPFGITASEDQSRFYVSTQDGSGDVHAIDLGTLSRDPQRSFRTASLAGGRLRHRGELVFLPTTYFDPGFSGSEGGVLGWSTGVLPYFWQRLLVDRVGQLVFPSGQDLEILADGRLLIGGTFFDNRLYLLEPSGVLQRTLRLSTFTGSAHGLGQSPDGKLLAVCDLPGSSIALVDLLNLEELTVIDLSAVGAGYTEPNEAVFWRDKLYVTVQGQEAVLVFDNLPVPTPGPGFAGSITVSDSAPAPGSSFTVTVRGPGKVALLAAKDDRPVLLQGVPLLLGDAPRLEGVAAASLLRRYDLPADPALRGRHLFYQGVTDAAGLRRPTAPQIVLIQ